MVVAGFWFLSVAVAGLLVLGVRTAGRFWVGTNTGWPGRLVVGMRLKRLRTGVFARRLSVVVCGLGRVIRGSGTARYRGECDEVVVAFVSVASVPQGA